MGSSRFPNKPLAPILGMAMVGHVYHRACRAERLSEVWVATCDQEIYDYVESIGGNAIMTADTHERATDRTAEALVNIEARTGREVEAVLMIQGDEPMLVPSELDELVAAAEAAPDAAAANLMIKITSQEEFEDLNAVKLVATVDGHVLYLSREPIPSKRRFGADVPMWRQLGIILFRREALLTFAQLEPTPLEIIESVDMNRFLEHGYSIKLAEATHQTKAVDTREDLAEVERLMRQGDLLAAEYLRA
jgi:3-deoxy-manno-octulosonate cytidylyltransferase (CMP-KDO synthetase)